MFWELEQKNARVIAQERVAVSAHASFLVSKIRPNAAFKRINRVYVREGGVDEREDAF